MSKLGKQRKKSDNSHFWLKCAIREEAISQLKEVRVLDCFAGKNALWKKVGCDYYYGIEMQKGKGDLNVHAENTRIIPQLDLSMFNVIDIDSYGIPFDQLFAICGNKTLPQKTIVIYTAIGSAISNMQKMLIEKSGIRHDVYMKCPMLFNKHAISLFYGFLERIGVKKVSCVIMKDGSYEKHYGYFCLEKYSGK